MKNLKERPELKLFFAAVITFIVGVICILIGLHLNSSVIVTFGVLMIMLFVMFLSGILFKMTQKNVDNNR